MSDSLALSIRLDSPDTTYDLGSDIGGTLVVQAHDDVEVRGLLVAPRYRVDSRGYDSDGGPDPVDLMPGGGAFRAGEIRELTFQVTLPFQPPPYDGRNFNVAWYVEAWADVAWARDPAAEPVPLQTRVGPASRDADYQRWVGAVEYDLEKEEAALGFFQRLKEGSCALKAAAGCFLPMFALGFSGRLSARKAVGELEIEAEPQVARPGDTIRCRVTYRASRDLSITGATITLQARERFDFQSRSMASDSSSTTRRTTWDTLHADARDMAGPTQVAAPMRRDLIREKPIVIRP